MNTLNSSGKQFDYEGECKYYPRTPNKETPENMRELFSTIVKSGSSIEEILGDQVSITGYKRAVNEHFEWQLDFIEAVLDDYGLGGVEITKESWGQLMTILVTKKKSAYLDVLNKIGCKKKQISKFKRILRKYSAYDIRLQKEIDKYFEDLDIEMIRPDAKKQLMIALFFAGYVTVSSAVLNNYITKAPTEIAELAPEVVENNFSEKVIMVNEVQEETPTEQKEPIKRLVAKKVLPEDMEIVKRNIHKVSKEQLQAALESVVDQELLKELIELEHKIYTGNNTDRKLQRMDIYMNEYEHSHPDHLEKSQKSIDKILGKGVLDLEDFDKALAICESGARPSVISFSDAIGLMQIKEDTAKENGLRKNVLRNLRIPGINIRVGNNYIVRIVKKYLSKCQGSDNVYRDLLASYNAGQNHVVATYAVFEAMKKGHDSTQVKYGKRTPQINGLRELRERLNIYESSAINDHLFYEILGHVMKNDEKLKEVKGHYKRTMSVFYLKQAKEGKQRDEIPGLQEFIQFCE